MNLMRVYDLPVAVYGELTQSAPKLAGVINDGVSLERKLLISAPRRCLSRSHSATSQTGECIGGKNMVPFWSPERPHRRGTADGHQTAVEARQAVRAMVRNEDQRAQALRDIGAEVGSAICSISTQRIR